MKKLAWLYVVAVACVIVYGFYWLSVHDHEKFIAALGALAVLGAIALLAIAITIITD